MVDFVDVFVEWTPMKRTVRPVMPCILQHKEDRDLICHGQERWEGYAGGEPEKLGHRMEEPDSVLAYSHIGEIQQPKHTISEAIQR